MIRSGRLAKCLRDPRQAPRQVDTERLSTSACTSGRPVRGSGDSRSDATGADRVAVKGSDERRPVASARERNLACDHLIEDHTETVDVARRADLAEPAVELLGRDVSGSAARACFEQAPVRPEQSGQPEVPDVQFARFISENILRLEVAMEDRPRLRIASSEQPPRSGSWAIAASSGSSGSRRSFKPVRGYLHRSHHVVELAPVFSRVQIRNDVRMINIR